MGAWLKKYKKGVAFYCNTKDKRISPISDCRTLMSAHIHALKAGDYINMLFADSMTDPRLVLNWTEHIKRAKKEPFSKEEIESFYEWNSPRDIFESAW